MFVYDFRAFQDSEVFPGHADIAHNDQAFVGRAAKRALDVFASASVLLLLAPFLLAIAAFIKLDSRGPVFYRQLRNGRNGSTFSILKFRSMRHEEASFLQCLPKDARVTRVGRFLRRTSIDELPQLINILLGHMSLVGPRPHAVEHDRQLAGVFPRVMERYAARPGLTGLAQVRGFRGPTDTRQAIEDRMHADLEYVRSASFWGDVKIILMTPAVVFGALNAH